MYTQDAPMCKHLACYDMCHMICVIFVSHLLETRIMTNLEISEEDPQATPCSMLGVVFLPYPGKQWAAPGCRLGT